MRRRERGGDRIGAGLGRAETRHAGGGERRQVPRGASGTRNAASGLPAPALSMIGCTASSGMEPRRRADDREHKIEFRRRQQNVERRPSCLVAGAGDREIDQARRRDLDPCGREARQRLGARPRRSSRRALASGSITMVAPPAVVVTTPTSARARTCRSRRHPRQQRQAPISASSVVDARDAASREEGVGHIVLARERAGMRDRKLARRGRTAELVGDDRLAALRGRERKGAQRGPRGAWFRETACSRRCRDRRASLRKSRRARDRPRCRPKPGRRSRRRGPCRATAARRSCCRYARRRRCARPASPVSSKAALAVSMALVRRSTTPRLDGPTRRRPVRAQISRSARSRARRLRAPASAKPSASTVATLHADAAAFARPPRSRLRSAQRCRRARAPPAARRARAMRARPAPARAAD